MILAEVLTAIRDLLTHAELRYSIVYMLHISESLIQLYILIFICNIFGQIKCIVLPNVTRVCGMEVVSLYNNYCTCLVFEIF